MIYPPFNFPSTILNRALPFIVTTLKYKSTDLGAESSGDKFLQADILAARPKLNADGSVRSWRYAVLLTSFDIFNSTEFDHHLFIISKINWHRGKDGEIYGATLSVEDNPTINSLVLSSIDETEYPDDAKIWQEHYQYLADNQERYKRALEQIAEIFIPMAEAEINGSI